MCHLIASQQRGFFLVGPDLLGNLAALPEYRNHSAQSFVDDFKPEPYQNGRVDTDYSANKRWITNVVTFTEMLQLLIAGAAGGMLRSLYYRADWKGFVVNIFAGAVVAKYLGPEGPEVLRWLLGDLVNPDALKNRMELSGFLLGAGGVAIVGWFYDIVDSKIKKGPRNGDESVG